MPKCVCSGAMIQCSFGTAPSTLSVTSQQKVSDVATVATTMDNTPGNLKTFGMCTTLSNPAVASATAAAMGVLTPQPCSPVTPGPWAPGKPTVVVGSSPALTDNSKLTCSYGGSISILPGPLMPKTSL